MDLGRLGRSLRGSNRKTRELQQGLRRPITNSGSQFEDPGITALTIQKARGDLSEELFDERPIAQDSVRLSARMDAALFAETDQALDHPLSLFGLGHGRADSPMLQKIASGVCQQRGARFGWSGKTTGASGVTHDCITLLLGGF